MPNLISDAGNLTFDLKVDEKFILVNTFSNSVSTERGLFLANSAAESCGENVPGVYVIYNDSEIYIGQSVEPYSRILSHQASKRVSPPFSSIIFASKQFTQSSIYDIETSLIRYASADRKRIARKIVNHQFEQSSKYYFLKQQYSKVADAIWSQLLSFRIARTQIPTIKVSAEYRYSPFMTLNDSQRKVVSEIMGADFPAPDSAMDLVDLSLRNEAKLSLKMTSSPWKEQITIVEGFPGTGKSVLASAIYSQIIKTSKACLVAGTVRTLNEFKKVFKDYEKFIQTEHPPVVVTSTELIKRLRYGEKFSAVVIDEGQRLIKDPVYAMASRKKFVLEEKKGEVDQIAQLMGGKGLVVMYDANQVVHPNDHISLSFNGMRVERKFLSQQERMYFGDVYWQTIFELFENGAVTDTERYLRYDFKVFSSFKSMVGTLKKYAERGEHCFLSSGYSRFWDKGRNAPEFQIEGISARWNANGCVNWAESKPARNFEEVGYYEYVQGLDADYCGVIIGKDLAYKNGTGSFEAVEAMVFGVKPRKKGTTRADYQKRLTEMVINRYKVLLTRGRKGTYVFIEDESVFEAFKRNLPNAIVY